MSCTRLVRVFFYYASADSPHFGLLVALVVFGVLSKTELILSHIILTRNASIMTLLFSVGFPDFRWMKTTTYSIFCTNFT